MYLSIYYHIHNNFYNFSISIQYITAPINKYLYYDLVNNNVGNNFQLV